jgi:hypothetical protein
MSSRPPCLPAWDFFSVCIVPNSRLCVKESDLVLMLGCGWHVTQAMKLDSTGLTQFAYSIAPTGLYKSHLTDVTTDTLSRLPRRAPQPGRVRTAYLGFNSSGILKNGTRCVPYKLRAAFIPSVEINTGVFNSRRLLNPAFRSRPCRVSAKAPTQLTLAVKRKELAFECDKLD